MSGPAPPNPGAPKINPNVTKSSILGRRAGLIVASTALAGVGYLYLRVPPSPRDQPVGSFRTPGVKNIEKAYTNAGATSTHTKAYGGTRQGDPDGILREGGGSGHPNKANPFEQEGLGDDQRPAGRGTKLGEVFDKTNMGSSKGRLSLTLTHTTMLTGNRQIGLVIAP